MLRLERRLNAGEGNRMRNGKRDDEALSQAGISALEHDVVRLDWAEREAYGSLMRAIQGYEPTRAAFERWQDVREQRLVARARLDGLLTRRGAARGSHT